jgi:hypothetical protein
MYTHVVFCVSRLGYDNKTYVRAPQLLKCVSFSRSAIGRGKSAALHNVCIFVWFGATRKLPPRSSFPHTHTYTEPFAICLAEKAQFSAQIVNSRRTRCFSPQTVCCSVTQSAFCVAASRLRLTNPQRFEEETWLG